MAGQKRRADPIMMTREPTTAVIPLRSLIALALCVFALGVLGTSVHPRASEGRAVSDLLHRAQSEADATRFLQLIVAVEGKPDGKIFAKTDNGPSDLNGGIVQPRIELPAAQVVPPPPAALAAVSTHKLLQVASVNEQARQPKFGVQKVHVVAEKAKNIWMNRGRAWVGLIGNGF
jgi:hypothetical protein